LLDLLVLLLVAHLLPHAGLDRRIRLGGFLLSSRPRDLLVRVTAPPLPL